MTMRKITSLTMLISFVLLIVTSVILYIVPAGRVAYWADWHLWGMSKTQWGNLHINLGFLFLAAGLLHLYYNWRPMLAYMKNKAREVKVFTGNFNLALLLCMVVGVGTLAEIPPMNTVIKFGESIKDAAADHYGEPPYGHAELTSLQLFSKKMNIDLTAGKELLAKAGIQVSDDEQSIGELAKENNISPKELYTIIKPAEVLSDTAPEFPETPPTGFGRKRLAEICTQYNLNIQTVLRGLEKQGIKTDPGLTLKNIAEENNTDPHSLFEILNGLVNAQ